MFVKDVSWLLPKLIEWRRHIHQDPELGHQEYDTQKYVLKVLHKLGIKGAKKIGITGVVVVLKGNRPGKTIGLRCDLDALPIQEETDVSYRSRKKGVMHACGHDGHIAMILGTACVLHSLQKEWCGNVKLIFQPAEEMPAPQGGARALIREGVLKHPKVDAILGLHLSPSLPSHHISFRPGAITTIMNEFFIELKGKEAHGSTPEKGISSILAASQIVLDLQKQALHHTTEWCSLNIGTIEGGTKTNIVPKETSIRASFRCKNETDNNIILDNIKDICKQTANSSHVQIKLEIMPSSSIVVNDSQLIQQMKPIVTSVAKSYDQEFSIKGSEDFGDYLQEIPGLYFYLGCNKHKKKVNVHSSTYTFDESVMSTGVLLLTNCVFEYLKCN
jgi:amidohydrolase